MLLQRLATGATGVKQAGRPTRGSEALDAHAQYLIHSLSILYTIVCMEGPWHLRIPPRVLHFSAFLSCVCVCVYLSVPALAASASVEDSKQRYSRVSLRFFLDFDSWIFEKPVRSKVIARKSQYAN